MIQFIELAIFLGTASLAVAVFAILVLLGFMLREIKNFNKRNKKF